MNGENGLMMKGSKIVRDRSFLLRVSEEELTKIKGFCNATTSRSASEYARNLLLHKPVIVTYRNASIDELLNEMIRLKKELNSINVNFNLAVERLHTFDKFFEVKAWLIENETTIENFMNKTEEIRLRMIQIYEQWSQK